MPYVYRILHLSDLHHHISEEDAGNRNLRRKLIEKLKEISTNAQFDCVVVSGDVFSQGSFTEDDAETLKNELWNKLLEINPNVKIIIAPGNHDLDRFAQHTLPGYNTFKRRSDIIKKTTVASTANAIDASANIDSTEREILYSNAFAGYHSYINNLRTSSHATLDTYPEIKWINHDGIQLTNELGEVTIDLHEEAIRFFVLNTSGFAGQIIRGDDYRRKAQALKNEAQSKRNECKFSEAVQIEHTIVKLQTSFENDGYICIDEEEVDNFGRMLLSEAGQNALDSIRRNSNEVCIFIGHHGLNFLSKKTNDQLKIAFTNTSAPLYLCGHAHNADTKSKIAGGGGVFDELQAGTLNKDTWTGSQYGFNIIEIRFDVRIEVTSKQYVLVPTHQNTHAWLIAPSPPVRIIERQPTRKTSHKVEASEDDKSELTVDGKGGKIEYGLGDEELLSDKELRTMEKEKKRNINPMINENPPQIPPNKPAGPLPSPPNTASKKTVTLLDDLWNI